MKQLITNIGLTKPQIVAALSVAKAKNYTAHTERTDRYELIADPIELAKEYERFSYLTFNGKGISGYKNRQASNEFLQSVSFEQFLAALIAPSPVFSFKLNDSYTADCDTATGEVTVGCQTIPIETIRELVKKFDAEVRKLS